MTVDRCPIETFSVYQFFPNGTYERLGQGLPMEDAVNLARSYTRPERPGVVFGVIKRVIITDEDDCCVFEWRNGEGITFPLEMAGRI